jgi:ankyrin repeat protein
MQLLLLVGVNVNARDSTGSTARMCAAWRGQTEAVKILLDKGADINVRKAHRTALLLAAEQGNKEVVRMLFNKNPDLNARDDSGWTS